MNAEALEKLVLMKMPFGKYAGRALADLPGNYLAWFAREGFPQGELGQLLELMHTLDHNGLRGLLAPIAQAHGLKARSSLLWVIQFQRQLKINTCFLNQLLIRDRRPHSGFVGILNPVCPCYVFACVVYQFI